MAFERTTSPDGTRSAPLIQLSAARSGQRFVARYSFSSIADDFYTASGFISRDSIANAHIDHGVTVLRKARADFLQTARVDLVLDGTWRYSRFVDAW